MYSIDLRMYSLIEQKCGFWESMSEKVGNEEIYKMSFIVDGPIVLGYSMINLSM